MRKIKIYSQPTCHDCKSVREYLDSIGVPYEEINVLKDKGALEEMVRKYGIRVTPVVVVDDEVMIGFNAYKLDKMLAGTRAMVTKR